MQEELLCGIVSEQWQRVSFLLRNKLLMLRSRKTETASYESFYDILLAQCIYELWSDTTILYYKVRKYFK